MMYRWIPILAALALAGCSGDNKPESDVRARQDAALRDPFNYSPNQDRNDISGGGLMQFKKDAFKKDVNSVLDP